MWIFNITKFILASLANASVASLQVLGLSYEFLTWEDLFPLV